MKYVLHINQEQAIELGIANIIQAHIFDLLTTASTWATPVEVEGETYFWVARQTIASELPLLDLKPDTVYRYIKNLAEIGIIDYVKSGKKDCLRISEKGKKYLSGTMSEKNPNPYFGKKSELEQNSEKNPRKLGKKSENNPENNPTDPTTSINPTTKDQKEPTPQKNGGKKSRKKKVFAKDFELPGCVTEKELQEFIDHRDLIKKPMSKLAVNKFLKHLVNLSNQGFYVRDLIDKAIMNGWQSVYAPNGGNHATSKKSNPVSRADQQRAAANKLVASLQSTHDAHG